MKKGIGMSLFLFLCLTQVPESAPALPAFLDRRPDEQQRETILRQSGEILDALYKSEPQAREIVEKAYGYATFSNFGVKILFAGSGTGRGVAVNNQTHEKTFMNMAELQAGLGLGVKKFMLIWVFENEKTFNRFVNSGWEIGGQASAAAKAKGKGASFQGAVQIASGIWLYQLTNAGLAVELTAKGTKYYKDNNLNTATANSE
jgi:lipid-binding SYLF domain-containing protein